MPAVCGAPTGTESKEYPCSEPRRPRCSKSDRLPLNDERLGFLYGNHIRTLIKGKTGLSRVRGIIYGLPAKGCYTDTQRGPASYTETIYTLLEIEKGQNRDKKKTLYFCHPNDARRAWLCGGYFSKRDIQKC